MGNVAKGLKNAYEDETEGQHEYTNWSTLSPVCIAMGPIRFYHKHFFFARRKLTSATVSLSKSRGEEYFLISPSSRAPYWEASSWVGGAKSFCLISPSLPPRNWDFWCCLLEKHLAKKVRRQIIKKCIGRRRRNFPFFCERERGGGEVFSGKLSEDTGGRKN